MKQSAISKLLMFLFCLTVTMSMVSCSSDDDDEPKEETLKSLKAGFRASLSTDVVKYFDVTAVITAESTGETRTEAIIGTTGETSCFSATEVPQTYTLVYKFTKKADAPETITSKALVISCRGVYHYTGTKGSFRENVLCTTSGISIRLEDLDNAPIDQILQSINNTKFIYTLTAEDVSFDSSLW